MQISRVTCRRFHILIHFLIRIAVVNELGSPQNQQLHFLSPSRKLSLFANSTSPLFVYKFFLPLVFWRTNVVRNCFHVSRNRMQSESRGMGEITQALHRCDKIQMSKGFSHENSQVRVGRNSIYSDHRWRG